MKLRVDKGKFGRPSKERIEVLTQERHLAEINIHKQIGKKKRGRSLDPIWTSDAEFKE